MSSTNNQLNSEVAFKNSFLLPVKYLPRRRKLKLEKSGKLKIPVVGTSDEWWKLEKEKEAKETRKKMLQAQKKALADQKKQILNEIKTLQD